MSSHSRYVSSSAAALSKLPATLPYSHLIESLTVLVNDYEPSSAVHGAPKGLFTGPTSVAYLFLWLSKLYSSPSASDSSSTITALSVGALYVADRSPNEWCRSYLKAAQAAHSRHPAGSRPGGIQDEALAYAVVKAAYTRDEAYVKRAIRLASDQLPSASNPTPSVDTKLNEWLYGRAGTLYLLRLLAHWMPSSRPQVATVMSAHAHHILSLEPWSWNGKPYLGAVHGNAGIVAQIALSVPELAPKLEPHVVRILDEQLPNGNWPSQQLRRSTDGHAEERATFPPPTPRMPHEELVQFCHGAPGVVLSLEAVRPHVSKALQARIDGALESARDAIWERGLLTKEPNLCHGISGNALAMGRGGDGTEGDVTRGQREEGDGSRRELMMRLATPARIAEGVVNQATFTPGSDAYGLLWGEAGRAWAWAVLDGKAEGFVGFTDV